MNQLMRIFEEIMYLGAIASVPVLLILLMKKLFHKVLSPKWHYYIWVILILRLLIPYMPESSFSILNLVYAVTEQSNLLENQVEATILYGPNNSMGDQLEYLQGSTGGTTTDEKEELHPEETPLVQSSSTDNKITYRAVFALLWLIGVIALSSYAIYVNIAFALKLRSHYRRITDPRIEAIFIECKRLLKVRGRISLYTSKIARTPSLYTAL